MVICQIPEFELYNITTKLAIIYKKILDYSKLELFIEQNYLYLTNIQNLKIIAKQPFICKVAFNSFALQK